MPFSPSGVLPLLIPIASLWLGSMGRRHIDDLLARWLRTTQRGRHPDGNRPAYRCALHARQPLASVPVRRPERARAGPTGSHRRATRDDLDGQPRTSRGRPTAVLALDAPADRA